MGEHVAGEHVAGKHAASDHLTGGPATAARTVKTRRGLRGLILIPATLAAFVGVSLPVGGDVAEARNLFERMFPRTAERRRIRRERRAKARATARRRAVASQRRATQRRATQRRATRRAQTRTRRASSRRASSADRVNVENITTVNRLLTYRATPILPIRTAGLRNRLNKKTAAKALAREKRAAILRQDRIGRIALAKERAAAAAAPAAETMSDVTDYLRFVRVRAEREIEAAMAKHYTDHPGFMWLNAEGRPNARARDMEAVFAAAENEALRPEDYSMPPEPEVAALSGIDVVDQQARAAQLNYEFTMTARALRYLRDAKHGRVVPDRLSTYHDFKANKVDFPALLAALHGSADPSAVLMDAHPKVPAYRILRAELNDLRSGAAIREVPVRVQPGTFMKPGWKNEEMPEIVRGLRKKASPELREKHAEALEAYDGGVAYTKGLVALVRDFQSEQGLSADGIIGKNTLARINDAVPKNRREKLMLAMERLRWHPDELGRRHVFINAPEYRVRYMVNDQERLAMNVVVGRIGNQTNFFHDEIEYVEFNPYWGVPRSILLNEYLGRIQSDPSWVRRRGYEVVNGRGRTVSPYKINWSAAGGTRFPYYLRQKPGPGNALGELKIMFPNRHAIYMHDTPHKKLFKRASRAYSHGCVRLEDPRAMAAAVLGTDIDRIAKRLKGGKNNAWRLKEKVPVYVSYFTAWPKADGTIGYHEDVYRRDRHLLRALNTTVDARTDADEL